MGRLLLLLFLAIPLIEIACFIVIGQAIGLWPTLLGVLLTAIAGGLVLRVQGMSLLNEMRATVGRGQLPARAIADAMMVGIAGLLLLTPGYFTDLLGLLLLLPPARSLIYRFLRSRLSVVATSSAGFTAPSRPLDQPDGTIDLEDDEWRPR